MLFPMLDLALLSTGAAIVYLTNQQTSVRASGQPRYNDALNSVFLQGSELNASALATFARVKPVGGYKNCGTDLYIQVSNYLSGTRSAIGPNTPMPPPVDTTSNIYEYMAESTYEVGPFISLKSVPFIGNIPGLGLPATIKFANHRVVEHPEGLVGLVKKPSLQGGQTKVNLSSVTGLDVPGQLTDGSGSGWNFPGIYQMIADAGQTVVAEDVITVQADNPNWTLTNLNIVPGEKLWIDYRADGLWTYRTKGSGTSPMFNANGDPNLVTNGFNTGSMLGHLGSGAPFFLGNRQWNFIPPGTGQLGLAMNDSSGPTIPPTSGYIGNQGVMTVRLIVAK